MTFQLQKRGERRLEVEPEFTQVGEETIIGAARWLDPDGRQAERFQVISLRDGKIVDLQGFASRRRAERFARRRAGARRSR